MSKSFFAKLFGYIGASALALGQAGVFGKYSSLLSAIGAIVASFGVHAASNTDGKQ